MIVVADSGPLQYLILLDQIHLLHRFYGQVVIPDAVANELRAAATPSTVSGWIARGREWPRTGSRGAPRTSHERILEAPASA